MEKAVIVFSGGVDSVCSAAMLSPRYELYGISFSYGQKADKEIKTASMFAKKLALKEHKIVDIGFMREIYADSNVLTSTSMPIPNSFEYSIVVPIRNAVFLAVASAWAYTLNASLVAYGAHTGDSNYPDCRPQFAKRLVSAFNQGERDGIRDGLRKNLKVWSPYIEGLSKSELLKRGYDVIGDSVFKTWSCYAGKRYHCGVCESCNNRKAAFKDANMHDGTRYLSTDSQGSSF